MSTSILLEQRPPTPEFLINLSLALRLARHRRYNNRLLELPWYGFWSLVLNDLFSGLVGFIVFPQYPLWVIPEDERSCNEAEEEEEEEEEKKMDGDDSSDDQYQSNDFKKEGDNEAHEEEDQDASEDDNDHWEPKDLDDEKEEGEGLHDDCKENQYVDVDDEGSEKENEDLLKNASPPGYNATIDLFELKINVGAPRHSLSPQSPTLIVDVIKRSHRVPDFSGLAITAKSNDSRALEIQVTETIQSKKFHIPLTVDRLQIPFIAEIKRRTTKSSGPVSKNVSMGQAKRDLLAQSNFLFHERSQSFVIAIAIAGDSWSWAQINRRRNGESQSPATSNNSRSRSRGKVDLRLDLALRPKWSKVFIFGSQWSAAAFKDVFNSMKPFHEQTLLGAGSVPHTSTSSTGVPKTPATAENVTSPSDLLNYITPSNDSGGIRSSVSINTWWRDVVQPPGVFKGHPTPTVFWEVGALSRTVPGSISDPPVPSTPMGDDFLPGPTAVKRRNENTGYSPRHTGSSINDSPSARAAERKKARFTNVSSSTP